MPETPSGILVVDDESSIRMSMTLVLTEFGYKVRSAADGFCALREIREEMPDILLTDLNMPGMSGFELLSVVWRRFPFIQKIAMSGAFSGTELPSGIAADAFYQKGSGTSALLQSLKALPQRTRPAPLPCRASALLRIDRDGHDSSPEGCITIACPECLRAFSQAIAGMSGFMRETSCVHCGSSIQYTVVEPPGQPRLQARRRKACAVQPGRKEFDHATHR
jgi:CheY-like chemotaxis protein